MFTPETDMATRVKWAAKALENAGFNTVADFLDAVYTTEFPARTPCAEIQKKHGKIVSLKRSRYSVGM